jgi:hypothetical protein
MASNTDLLRKGMTEMKRPAEPKPSPVEAVCCDEEKYPYGLRVDLSNDSLKALGLSAADFTAGAECEIIAVCKVTSVSSRENQKAGGETKKNDNVDLQITKMKLVKDKKKD